MKFLIFLMAFFSMILAFIHICKRMGIDVIGILNRLGNKPTTQTIVHPNQPLHKMFNNEYQWVALFMWRCLMAVQMRELDVPDTVEGIYCRNTVDRIRKYNGQWCFYYEVPLCALSSIRELLFLHLIPDFCHSLISVLWSRFFGNQFDRIYCRGCHALADIAYNLEKLLNKPSEHRRSL